MQEVSSMSENVLLEMKKNSWRDYWVLCKPRVVALMILTSVVGMFLATPGWVPLSILWWGNVGIALAACSAAAINHIIEREIDRLMRRTEQRPIAQGRVSPREAFIFSGILCVLSMTILVVEVNTLTALLTFLTLIGYAIIYTVYLKHATPQNIVIGGAAGAAPPLLGWVAVTGHLDAGGFLLMMIIFVWTPPHFWALAIHRIEDYAKANIPMLPNRYGIPFTKFSIFLYTILLTATTVLPFLIGMSGWIYLVGTMLLNARFLYWVVRLWKSQDNVFAFPTFKFSITYLMGLFGFLLIDHFVSYLVPFSVFS